MAENLRMLMSPLASIVERLIMLWCGRLAPRDQAVAGSDNDVFKFICLCEQTAG